MPPKRSHRPALPAKGTAQWVIRPGADPDALPCLRITAVSEETGKVASALYNLHVLVKGAGASEEVVGYALTNLDNGKQHHIDVSGPAWRCDCGDACFRERPKGCKHVAGLCAALKHLGLLPAEPQTGRGEQAAARA
jgi:hypothetical protein